MHPAAGENVTVNTIPIAHALRPMAIEIHVTDSRPLPQSGEAVVKNFNLPQNTQNFAPAADLI